MNGLNGAECAPFRRPISAWLTQRSRLPRRDWLAVSVHVRGGRSRIAAGTAAAFALASRVEGWGVGVAMGRIATGASSSIYNAAKAARALNNAVIRNR